MSIVKSVARMIPHKNVTIPKEYSELKTQNIDEIKKVISQLYSKYEEKELLVFKNSSSVPKWASTIYDAIQKNPELAGSLQNKMNAHITSFEHNLEKAKTHLTDFVVFVIQKCNTTNHELHIKFAGELSVAARNDIIFQIPHSFHQNDQYSVRRDYPDPNDHKNSPIKYIPEKYASTFDVVYSMPALEIAQLESNLRALKRLFTHL